MHNYKNIAILAFVILLPLIFGESFQRHILISMTINSILAISLGIVIGYLGELSLAHGAFYGIGAYTSALLTMNISMPFWGAFICSIVFAGCLGFFIGIPALRLSGHYFVIATLGFQGIVVLLITNLVDLTRGPMGLPGIPALGEFTLFGRVISFASKLNYYYLSLAVLILVFIVTRNLLKYKFGKAFIATREDTLLASSIGIKASNYRLLAFIISASIAGAAGSLYAHYSLFISPDSFNLSESVFIATMVIIGGRSSLLGPIIGAIILTFIPEVLRATGGLQHVLYGLMLIVVVIFFPKGLAGIYQFACEKLAQKRVA